MRRGDRWRTAQRRRVNLRGAASFARLRHRHLRHHPPPVDAWAMDAAQLTEAVARQTSPIPHACP